MSFRAQHHAALSQLAGLSSLSLSVPLVKFRLLHLASVFRSSSWHSTQRFHCVQSPPKLASTKLLKLASLIQPQGQRSFVNSISCHPPEHFRQAQEPTLPHPAHTCQIRFHVFHNTISISSGKVPGAFRTVLLSSVRKQDNGLYPRPVIVSNRANNFPR